MRGGDSFDYESIPAGYYDMVHGRGYGIQSFWHYSKFHSVEKIVRAKKVSSLLDFACGPGTFIGCYLPQVKCVGIDVAEVQIGYATEHYENTFHDFQVVGVTHDLLKLKQFDAVTLIEFIEHIPEEEGIELLSKLRDNLKSGAPLILTTPNYGSVWPIIEFLIDRFGKGPKYDQQHITKLRRGRLKSMLEKSGFRVESIVGIHGVAPFSAALSWKLAIVLRRLEGPLVRRTGLLLMAVAYPSSELSVLEENLNDEH
jgi:2-polyprenyl-3-methyl-5-hydroxy-6-metoxy-1,4-benzoquinol methylase